MQMICAFDTMLLFTCETKFAPATDATNKANTNKLTNLDVVADAWSKSNDAADTFVASDMGQLDVQYRTAVGT